MTMRTPLKSAWLRVASPVGGPIGGQLTSFVASLAALTMLASSLSGCGYRAGLAPSLPPVMMAAGDANSAAGDGAAVPGRVARTIGIEIFGNESQVPNLERELHEALSSAARRYTSLELVSPAHADLVIRGQLIGFERARGARTTNNRFVETRNVVSVVSQAVDRAQGVEVARTSTEVGFGTAIDVPGREPDARSNALRNSADRILLTLLAELEYGVSRQQRPLPEVAPGG